MVTAVTMDPGALTLALTHYDIAADKGTTATEIAAGRKLAQLIREYLAEQTGTWTVIGVWDEDQAIVTGVIQGTHGVYGGDDYDAFPQGCWATSATAPDADTAEALAVEEMMATLEHDEEDEEDEEATVCGSCGVPLSGGRDGRWEDRAASPTPGSTHRTSCEQSPTGEHVPHTDADQA